MLTGSACAAVVCVLVSGCGSSPPPGTSADPALAVPASAVVYVGATVRPTGALAKRALAVGRALSHQQDPYLRLVAALETPGSATLDYKRDVAPWLGINAGIFLTSLRNSGALPTLLERGLLGTGSGSAFPFGAGGAEGAIVMDTRDAPKAESFLDAQAARAGAHATSYRGVPFHTSPGGVAFALVNRFAVIGSEAAVRSVIETAASGSSSSAGDGDLAGASGYQKLLAAAPPKALAHLYFKPTPPAQGGQEGLGGALQVLAGNHEANISVVPAGTSVALDADTLASPASASTGGLFSVDSESAQALDELPGEAWLAIGIGHAGTELGTDVQSLQQLASLTTTLGSAGPPAPTTGLSLGGLVQGLIAPLAVLGADTPQAKRQFQSWMGSAGIFASGSSLFELRGAVVISSKDPALSRAAVSALAAELRKSGASVSPTSIPDTDAAVTVRLSGVPLPLAIADGHTPDGRTKFVLGLEESSVTSALNPTTTLAQATSHMAAVGALGEGIQPSVMVSFPTLVSLLEGVGLVEAPPLSQFVPYLRATTLAGGGHRLSGEVQRFRLVLGL